MDSTQAICEETLLRLSANLTHVQAEKVAIQLKIDESHISTLRRMYVEDAELFAFRLLQKWWNACELDDDEAKNELGEALKSSQLAGLARNFLGLQDNNKDLSKQYLLSTVENLNSVQIEYLAIALGVKSNVIDSLRKMYSEDSQLFGFYVLTHWKDNCELEPEQQKELLNALLENPFLSLTSCKRYDDVEVDFGFRTSRGSNCFKSKQNKRRFCWICVFSLFVSLLLIPLACISILLKVPHLNDYSIDAQPGYTFLLPLNNWTTALDLQLKSDRLVCTGKAMAIDCSKVTPQYNFRNVTQKSFIYMSVGSTFYFEFDAQHTEGPDPLFLWIFSDFITYSTALTIKFQGLDCGSPIENSWCYEISKNTKGSINYTVPRDGFYEIICYPNPVCVYIKRWLMNQGSYQFSNYIGSSHPHIININEHKSTQLTYRSQYEFSNINKCLLVTISGDFLTSCSIEQVTLIISNQVRRYGYLLFPSIAFLFLLLFLIAYLVICCCKLLPCLRRSTQNHYMELTDVHMNGY